MASVTGVTLTQADFSASHLNAGMTATAPPQETPPQDSGWPSSPPAQEAKRPGLLARRGVVLAVIAILAILLVGTTFETGVIGSVTGATAINSPSSPFTGQQLYTAYLDNQAQATTQYTNKTVYIQDTLDFGVSVDLRSGEYYSTVDSGAVVLIWSNPSQVGQLSAGNTVLAKCSVAGAVGGPGGRTYMEVYLENCDLIKVQSQTGTQASSSFNVPSNND